MLRIGLMISMALFTTACQKVGLYLANIGNDDTSYQVSQDIAYGDADWQRLDVYVPAGDGPHPSVVFYYGGSWSSGSKDSYAFVANTLAQHGFATIIPDYVKYPQAKYPAFQKDAALVSKWLIAHGKDHALDTGNMHLLGHSAGAHIAAMLLADERFLAEVNLSPYIYQSFVGLAGPYHFTPEAEQYKQIFGPPEHYPRMQASHFIDGSEPAMLLLHGEDDNLVGVSNLENLSAAIKKHGGEVETKIIPDMGHLGIMAKFSATINNDNKIVQDSVAFFLANQPSSLLAQSMVRQH